MLIQFPIFRKRHKLPHRTICQAYCTIHLGLGVQKVRKCHKTNEEKMHICKDARHGIEVTEYYLANIALIYWLTLGKMFPKNRKYFTVHSRSCHTHKILLKVYRQRLFYIKRQMQIWISYTGNNLTPNWRKHKIKKIMTQ